MKSRPVASVHIDLARLQYEYSKVSLDSALSLDSKDSKESAEKLVRARAKWIDDLVTSLVLHDPSLSKYGAYLLSQVEEYRKAESERKKAKTHSADSVESLESKDSTLSKKVSKKDKIRNTGSIQGEDLRITGRTDHWARGAA